MANTVKLLNKSEPAQCRSFWKAEYKHYPNKPLTDLVELKYINFSACMKTKQFKKKKLYSSLSGLTDTDKIFRASSEYWL